MAYSFVYESILIIAMKFESTDSYTENPKLRKNWMWQTTYLASEEYCQR